jgi:hypothetical protein
MDAETTAHGSSDLDSAHAHGGSSVNQIRISLGSKEFWLSLIIAANLIAMLVMYYEWRESAMEQRLKEYNLDWFKGHEFAELNGRVTIQGVQIQALQIQKACTK